MEISPFIKDLTGQRFGSLIIVRLSHLGGGIYNGKRTQHAYWLCKCDCGAERVVRGTQLRRGIVVACKECTKPLSTKRWRASAGYSPQSSAVTRLCESYRHNAQRRGIVFGLTREQLMERFDGNCFYCGCPPSAVANPRGAGEPYPYNGIDRIDNALGYTPENTVSCCATCNYAKREMGAAEFIAWARRVAEYHSK